MPYYTRVFCTSKMQPSVSALECALRVANPNIQLLADDPKESEAWQSAEFVYDSTKQPIVVECNSNSGPESLGAVECEEFKSKIGRPGMSIAKRRVLEHLTQTQYIVSCQLLGDIDDNGYDLNGELMLHFVSKYGGLIQADGEGFYNGHKVLVPLK